MSQGNDNVREEYARQRIKNSPLSSLQKYSSTNPPTKLSLKFPPVVKIPLTSLDVPSYRFIQSAIADTILQVALNGKNIQLSIICDIIYTETRNIEAMGINYLKEYMKELNLDVEYEEEEKDNGDNGDNNDNGTVEYEEDDDKDNDD